MNKNAKILFDMFLKQGNNSRRFIEYNYVNNEEIDINKFNIVHNVSDDIYNTTKSFFKKNILLLDNGAFSNKFKLAFKSQL
ncbi:type II toxin-antitoxin system RnlB family antitoxin [Mucispirillum schaedleri]|uniref:type II toxin-antitoxin system RnlB family antitoxin n=1 Tax=Mucispirillum schaedleri TaxID=248039 RepID=UPI0032EDA73B